MSKDMPVILIHKNKVVTPDQVVYFDSDALNPNDTVILAKDHPDTVRCYPEEQVRVLREALEDMIEVGEAYQGIIWNEDEEGDNYDEAIEYAKQALEQTKGSE